MNTVLKWLKKSALIIWLLFLMLVGANMAYDNHQLLTLRILGFEWGELSSGIALCAALVLGILAGALFTLPVILAQKIRLQRLMRKYAKAEARILH